MQSLARFRVPVLCAACFRGFCTPRSAKGGEAKKVTARRKKVSKVEIARVSKENWLNSLSVPQTLYAGEELITVPVSAPRDNALVLGIDPDFNGALAVLRVHNEQVVPEVFDIPTIKVAIGKTLRIRPDARSILNILENLKAPEGSVAYVENSLPYCTDGKQSWWSSGFGFGLWIGSLMASRISVVPVPAREWKQAMGLAGGSINKEESRTLASLWFPTLAPQLKRKRDHGRAEAVLLAAYGKGMVPPESELRRVQTTENFTDLGRSVETGEEESQDVGA